MVKINLVFKIVNAFIFTPDTPYENVNTVKFRVGTPSNITKVEFIIHLIPVKCSLMVILINYNFIFDKL